MTQSSYRLYSIVKMNYDIGYNARLYFLNGMGNTRYQALSSARKLEENLGLETGSIGVLNHQTSKGYGLIGDSIEYLQDGYTHNDILNAYQFKQIQNNAHDQNDLILHSAGNKDGVRALELTALQGGRLDKLNFISVGSPVGSKQIDDVIQRVGASYSGQFNTWKDPVAHLKSYGTIGAGMVATGIAKGVLYGASFSTIAGPAAPLVTTFSTIAGAGIATAGLIYQLNQYHSIQKYYNHDEKLRNLLKSLPSPNKSK